MHSRLIFAAIVQGRYCYNPQFADKETKAQRGTLTCLRFLSLCNRNMTHFRSSPEAQRLVNDIFMLTSSLGTLNCHKDKLQGC